MNTTLFTTLYDLMRKNDHLFCIGNATQHATFEKLSLDFPGRFIDSTHKESTVLAMCTALLYKNKAVILCVTIPQFITRWYEQLVNDFGYKTFQFIIIGLPAGNMPWGSLRPELTLAYTIPNLNIISPATKQECGTLISLAFLARRLFYVHFNSLKSVTLEPEDDKLPALYQPLTYAKGSQIACIGIGSALYSAHQVKTHLESYGYSAATISLHTLKPLQKESLLQILHRYSAIFIFEEIESSVEVGKIIGAFFAENVIKQIVFKSFSPTIDNEQSLNHSQINQYPQKALNIKTCTLEIVEKLIHANIIPTHPSWNKN